MVVPPLVLRTRVAVLGGEGVLAAAQLDPADLPRDRLRQLGELDPADPLHYSNTEADAVSVALPSEPSTRGFAGGSCLKNSSRYANVWHYPVPVYFDTDHNCPGQILTPAQIDTLYYLGYYILQLGIGNPASEAALAQVAMSRQ